MASKRLEALRAQVLAKQTRANAKVSRLRTRNGVDIAGSQFDPRVDAARVSRMTTKQLERLNDNLTRFTSRKTQYYSGMNGAIITIREKRQLENAQRMSNEYRTEWLKLNEGLIGPNGRPLRERRDLLAKKRSSHLAVNDPFLPSERKLKNINPKFLPDLLGRLKDEGRPGYELRLGEKRRSEYLKMADLINSPGLRQDIEGLSSRQFTTLWHMTDFPNLISNSYEAFGKGEDDMLEDEDSQLSQELRQAFDAIKWAKTTPE